MDMSYGWVSIENPRAALSNMRAQDVVGELYIGCVSTWTPHS